VAAFGNLYAEHSPPERVRAAGAEPRGGVGGRATEADAGDRSRIEDPGVRDIIAQRGLGLPR